MSQKLKNNNVFTIAKRNVDGQDMLYQSLKLTNGIWVLAELKIQPGNLSFTVSHAAAHARDAQATAPEPDPGLMCSRQRRSRAC